MSYRRARSLDKNLIFAEYFNSEQELRKEGGLPTDVTFSQGKGTFNASSSNAVFPNLPSGTYSVRVRFKTGATLPNSIFIDFRGSAAGAGYFGININALSSSSGTHYLNGELGTALVVSTEYEAVLAGVTITNGGDMYMASNYVPSGWYDGELWSIEVYSGTLSATQISNLYDGVRYIPPQLSKVLDVNAHSGVIKNKLTGDTVGSNLNTNSCENNDYTTFSGASASGFSAISNGGGTHNAGTADQIPIVLNHEYQVVFTLTLNSGTAPSYNFKTALGSTARTLEGAQLATSGVNVFTFTANAAAASTVVDFQNTSTATDYVISDLQVRKVVSEPTLIATAVKKEGAINAILCDKANTEIGPAGNITNGYFNDLTGDITILTWVKAYSQGEGTVGTLLDNSKVQLRIGGGFRIYFYGNGTAFTFTNPATIPVQKWKFIAVTRASNAVTNIWVDDLKLKTDANTGTPVVGTTPLTIGNSASPSRTWDGLISEMIVTDDILTEAEISQYYTATKHLYNK